MKLDVIFRKLSEFVIKFYLFEFVLRDVFAEEGSVINKLAHGIPLIPVLPQVLANTIINNVLRLS